MDPRDIQCRTPLFLAASVGGTETVQLLMDRGADITLKDVELRSPLHAAIGSSATLEALIKVTDHKKGTSPACKNGTRIHSVCGYNLARKTGPEAWNLFASNEDTCNCIETVPRYHDKAFKRCIIRRVQDFFISTFKSYSQVSSVVQTFAYKTFKHIYLVE